jgi:outer membrane receptor protein involved in Fe transport
MPPTVAETANVVGQQVAVTTIETNQIEGTITNTELVKTGLNGRNFTQLIALAPGVSNQTGQDEARVGLAGSVKYSVNGGRVEYNNFDVDGGDVLNAGLNGAESTLMVYPSLDAIQDVKVLTSNYGAMYGRSASGTVLVMAALTISSAMNTSTRGTILTCLPKRRSIAARISALTSAARSTSLEYSIRRKIGHFSSSPKSFGWRSLR